MDIQDEILVQEDDIDSNDLQNDDDMDNDEDGDYKSSNIKNEDEGKGGDFLQELHDRVLDQVTERLTRLYHLSTIENKLYFIQRQTVDPSYT